ncbi:ATP-dependent zinc metalloprotease FtsH [Singulisphaera acidiphila]|uniref:ATP-dependent zinc metalloprotease FtsH n=1 Tax=Singulisphaera acidiphila (strain ATCC BAA-1392 / DSM 18658 / VKM B-2454 / MOB10) TaxID=886293 RepID=L0DBB2_SINAD|nr:ATP-dependent zinc metalloprotease FtsH [Singulisphaera acidiphila]AGA26150.1 ATP-dependent metalloprotease FtsH [Singulisphaera acidiphila DSM 18658]
MDPKTPRIAPPRHSFSWSSPWLLLAAALLFTPILIYWSVTFQSGQDIGYGDFLGRLEKGEIRSAKVGPTWITGELKNSRSQAPSAHFYTSRVGLEDDQQLFQLLREKLGTEYQAEAGPSLVQTVFLPTFTLTFLIVALWVMMKRSGGMGSAMAFAKSRPKVYEKDERRVTFDDVAGNEEAVTELREVVEFLRTPEKYEALGGRIPKGVLLAGPPGTGKTLLAKAVAGEAGVPFFSLSGSDFVEMFVGVGAARVRSLFQQAEAKAPCLIFIDELDALGKARGTGGGNHDERDQTLNQLLVQMDGFNSNRGIILIAATNRPEMLDPALVRPGRFDRQVVVDRPDIIGREDILKVHVKTVALDEEINLRQIAAMTSGFVGADLANLVNEAALLAARKGKTKVGSDEFQEGVERVIAGPEKRQRVLVHEEKVRIAYHEAGHALVSRSLPQTDPVHKITILGRGTAALGYTMYRPEDDRFLHTRTWLESTICSLLGGTVAEEIVYGEVSDGATSDLQRATQIARRMVTDFGMSPKIGRVSYQTDGRSPFLNGGGANDYACSPRTAREIDLEVRRILDEAQQAAALILSERRNALEEITRTLMDHESIDASELQGILDAHPYEIRPISALV